MFTMYTMQITYRNTNRWYGTTTMGIDKWQTHWRDKPFGLRQILKSALEFEQNINAQR